MSILITGGAGYIGSHVLKQLLERGEQEIIVLDNLSTGSQAILDTLRRIGDFKFVRLDLADFERVRQIFSDHAIESIIHFAASIVVPESVKDPMKYYMNNTVNTANLVQCALDSGVKRFIFSSTAAVYGEPSEIPSEGISEAYPTLPINPYGASKLMSERIIADAALAHPEFKYIIFRYFNVAGADLQSRIGQSFPNATHLIKIASECAAKKRESLSIFGEDYPTKDGTGVRDYIHVDDLALAHIQGLEYLKTHPSDLFNCGYGAGYSVKEVIQTAKEVTGEDFTVHSAPRRAGDPAALVADNRKIMQKMGWNPQYQDLRLIIKSAYEWEVKQSTQRVGKK